LRANALIPSLSAGTAVKLNDLVVSAGSNAQAAQTKLLTLKANPTQAEIVQVYSEAMVQYVKAVSPALINGTGITIAATAAQTSTNAALVVQFPVIAPVNTSIVGTWTATVLNPGGQSGRFDYTTTYSSGGTFTETYAGTVGTNSSSCNANGHYTVVGTLLTRTDATGSCSTSAGSATFTQTGTTLITTSGSTSTTTTVPNTALISGNQFTINTTNVVYTKQ